MKRRILTAVLIITVLSGLTGCSGSDMQSSNEVTMYLWDKSMCKELTPWLEEQFPEIKFNFVVGNNSIDYYNYLQEHGELPDIITCRRFSLNDAAELSEHLMDMSKTQLAGTFYSSYIGNNRDSSGAIKWLPMCAEVDGIIANRDLLKKYGVSLPENYEEFVRVCSFFEEKGITGFANDYNQDYSCLEAMQGSAIPELMSPEGTRWREEYESEKEEDDENGTQKLPNFTEGEELNLKEIKKEQKFTKPPTRYSDATLIKAMEENGIGRPATYANVISVLAHRDYTEKEGKLLKPTNLGETVTEEGVKLSELSKKDRMKQLF